MTEIRKNAPAGPAGMVAPTERLVPAHSTKKDNARINEHTINAIKKTGTASYSDLTARIRKLQWEWDIERAMEAHSALLIIVSLVLGYVFHEKVPAMILAACVAASMLLHALHGWSPQMIILRRMGYRTSYEIMDELVAVRMLRGDFDALLCGPDTTDNAFKEGRRGQLTDELIRNMRESGRLLGRL